MNFCPPPGLERPCTPPPGLLPPPGLEDQCPPLPDFLPLPRFEASKLGLAAEDSDAEAVTSIGTGSVKGTTASEQETESESEDPLPSQFNVDAVEFVPSSLQTDF